MDQLKGYIEGYYGCLLSWPDRAAILKRLHVLGLNAYCYAPKEDNCHRLCWREPYDQGWINGFSAFCELADKLNIRVMAGIAPGLDYHFSPLVGDGAAEQDFTKLLDKSSMLLEAGANNLVLLMDDIDADFAERNPGSGPEGFEHAHLANRLAEALGDGDGNGNGARMSLFVVPRVYADEIHQECPDYLPAFSDELASDHRIIYCGRRIVESSIDDGSLSLLRSCSQHQVVFWDNLYANDYCPRRLFLGQWRHRQKHHSIMLNPTGLPRTDELLLSMMAAENEANTTSQPGNPEIATSPEAVFAEHGVPSCFASIAHWFDLPPFDFPDSVDLDEKFPASIQHQLDALETLLWRWKSPLSREWYPYLMGLKQDLLLISDNLANDRIHKTQTQAIAHFLLQRQNS